MHALPLSAARLATSFTFAHSLESTLAAAIQPCPSAAASARRRPVHPQRAARGCGTLLLPAVAMPLAIPGSPGSEEDGGDGEGGDGSPTDCMGSGGLNQSRYRGVSYDRKKAKWRVQIKVGGLRLRQWRPCVSGQ